MATLDSDSSDSERQLQSQRPCESETGVSSSKRMKIGAAIYKTKFNHSWKQEYPSISEVKRDPYKFFCTVCSRSVSCDHQGKRDVERHVSKALHQNNARSLKSQALITIPRMESSSSQSEKVTRAEVKVAKMIV
uniref:Uncharacterized protein n=1 Tax=Amphimedon queenslandica TaxID=400682 RepID=A0A1X7T8S4_AMPQE